MRETSDGPHARLSGTGVRIVPYPAVRRRTWTRGRRRRALLALCGIVLIVAAFAACLVLTHGFHRVFRFLTVPTLEADSGIKYTPTGAIKRKIEKVDEKRSTSE